MQLEKVSIAANVSTKVIADSVQVVILPKIADVMLMILRKDLKQVGIRQSPNLEKSLRIGSATDIADSMETKIIALLVR